MTSCPRCGSVLALGAAACGACGLKLSDPAAVTVLAGSGERGPDALLAALRADLGKEYDIEAVVGHGGMGVVYRGVERELARRVAIKVLPLGTAPELAERFKREARVAANLDHTNVIPIYRVGTAAGTHFFTMKYIDGRALDAIIERQGALSVPVVVAVLRGMLAGLAYAHEHGIVHRDIKGANVLVDIEGRVLLADLGIARALNQNSLTEPGSVLGTPHFMSPEQCAGQAVGPPSDQYAVGVLAFQMLAGQLPFDSETMVGVLHHHILTAPPELAGVRDDIPAELEALVRQALAKAPGDRFATTRAMLKAVEAVPVSAAGHEQAEADLKRLAHGEPLPVVRTRSVPPQAAAAITITPAAVTLRTPPASAPAKPVAAAPPPPATAPARPPRPAPARKPSVLVQIVRSAALLVVGAGAAVLLMRRGQSPAGAPPASSGPAAAAAAMPQDTLVRDSARLADSVRMADSVRLADSVRMADSVRVADSTRAADSARAAAARSGGWVRILGDLPDDAVVWFNGLPRRGRFLPVPPGRYTVEVQTSEFQPWEREVVVRPGDTLRLRVDLELKPDQ